MIKCKNPQCLEQVDEKHIHFCSDFCAGIGNKVIEKNKCCTECKNGGKIGVPLVGCCNGCKCHKKDNEIVKIFENVYGDYLLASWFDRTPLEKERKLEQFTSELNKWIKFNGFE